MGFQLHTREVGRVVVLEAVGKLTLTDGHTQLRDLVHVFAANGSKKFILNLARTDHIDSYGIGELLRTFSVVRQAGGDMKLACVNEHVLDVLKVSRMNWVFEIHPAEDVALRAFGERGGSIA